MEERLQLKKMEERDSTERCRERKKIGRRQCDSNFIFLYVKRLLRETLIESGPNIINFLYEAQT